MFFFDKNRFKLEIKLSLLKLFIKVSLRGTKMPASNRESLNKFKKAWLRIITNYIVLSFITSQLHPLLLLKGIGQNFMLYIIQKL